eukprot:16539-Heterococcus_DN1.PRE.5
MRTTKQQQTTTAVYRDERSALEQLLYAMEIVVVNHFRLISIVVKQHVPYNSNSSLCKHNSSNRCSYADGGSELAACAQLRRYLRARVSFEGHAVATALTRTTGSYLP